VSKSLFSSVRGTLEKLQSNSNKYWELATYLWIGFWTLFSIVTIALDVIRGDKEWSWYYLVAPPLAAFLSWVAFIYGGAACLAVFKVVSIVWKLIVGVYHDIVDLEIRRRERNSKRDGTGSERDS